MSVYMNNFKEIKFNSPYLSSRTLKVNGDNL